jgi:hypothetical protein
LEKELHEDAGGNGNEEMSNGETIADLKRRLRERDEKIMSLESEVAKWEKRYLEENALRQAAIEAASLPRSVELFAFFSFFLHLHIFSILMFSVDQRRKNRCFGENQSRRRKIDRGGSLGEDETYGRGACRTKEID